MNRRTLQNVDIVAMDIITPLNNVYSVAFCGLNTVYDQKPNLFAQAPKNCVVG